jgi:hypothetical protein
MATLQKVLTEGWWPNVTLQSMVTDGWWGTELLAGGNIITLATGALAIAVYVDITGDPYLSYTDASGTVKVELPLSANQMAGISWALFKVVRAGTSLMIYLDGVLIETATLGSVVPVGGKAVIADENTSCLHDIRVCPTVVSSAATNYYQQNLIEDIGNSFMPLARNVTAAPAARKANLAKVDGGDLGDVADAAGKTLYLYGGTLAVTVEPLAGIPTLILADGTSSVSHALPMTAAQIAGTAWSRIRLVRTGTALSTYVDGVLVATDTVTLKTYGGGARIGCGVTSGLHDVRIVGATLSTQSDTYYGSDITENSGKATMP